MTLLISDYQQHELSFNTVGCPLCGKTDSEYNELVIREPVWRLKDGFCLLPRFRYRFCSHDGLIYLKNRPGSETLDWYYENSPQLYRPTQKLPRSSDINRLDWIEEYLPETNQPKALLDIGCNDGSFLLAAKNRDWQTRGIEPAATVAHQTQQQHPQLDIEIASLSSIQNNPEFANPDLITLTHVFEHLLEPNEALKTLAGLNPEFIFLEVPGSRAPLFPRITREHGHLHYYNRNNLSALLHKHGFNPLAWREYDNGEPARSLRLLARYCPEEIGEQKQGFEPKIKDVESWKKLITRVDEEYRTLKKTQIEWLAEARRKKVRIGFYGAGTDCLSWLRVFKPLHKQIKAVFDGQPFYQGKSMPAKIPILPPGEDDFKEIDWLIITPRGQEEAIQNNLAEQLPEKLEVRWPNSNV